HVSTDFSQPCEEVAELEWLSNFVEDCYSHKFSNTINLSSSSDQTNQSSTTSNQVPAKTRSKRSRANPSNWASQIPILNPTQLSPSSSSSSDLGTNTRHPIIPDVSDGVRRCLHCGSDKTPQWRMGPMGPKTLCNACGVRYKSGRLVPEYRPAASPTFVVSEHSNSHRKVVELRRQKEMQKQQQMLFWS
ncbi:GATA transcription factor 9-like, partial [Asparagus officinalis]|uniref:GATA transcription factor 9-like n=1 Tax=Asparagus officinalis TaxID=4686 RepID=UPI00098E47A1